MYKLVVEGVEFFIPKNNIKLLAWQKAIDMGILSGDICDEKSAISFLEEIGIKVEENNE